MTPQVALKPLVSSYLLPSTVEEALTLAATHDWNFEYTAGGTDSQSLRHAGLSTRPVVIDLTRIPEMRGIAVTEGTLSIGSLTTLHELARHPEIAARYPLIAEAAASIATPVIRKTATLGGNLLVNNRCTFYNQSSFWRNSIGSCLRDTGDTCLVTGIRHGKCFARNVSDLAPAMITLSAEVTFRDINGEETIPLEHLYVSDGLRPHRFFGGTRILTGIRVSLPIRSWGYRKLRLRQSLDFTSMTAAATLDHNGHYRISLNGIAMSPVFVQGSLADSSLEGVIHQLRLKSKVADNDPLPLEYRREMISVYVNELWQKLKST